MTIITVDSTLDIVDPNDGFTTLREAIEAANQDAGRDTITFADELRTIVLEDELVVAAGTALNIKGGGDITISGDQQTYHFLVERTAEVNLENLELVDGHAQGAKGGDGGDGGNGGDGGESGEGGTAGNGGDGGNGGFGGVAGAGASAAGSILNFGDLSLEDINLNATHAEGGAGGHGGTGGYGGAGGNGGDSGDSGELGLVWDGGDGGQAGRGGDGGKAGDGGGAAVILNFGQLDVQNGVGIHGSVLTGGDGGHGGWGGDGGDGGLGGNGDGSGDGAFLVSLVLGDGGAGGDGGDGVRGGHGGNGGQGGFAALIANLGGGQTVGVNTFADFQNNTLTAGAGGDAGGAGLGGTGGSGGTGVGGGDLGFVGEAGPVSEVLGLLSELGGDDGEDGETAISGEAGDHGSAGFTALIADLPSEATVALDSLDVVGDGAPDAEEAGDGDAPASPYSVVYSETADRAAPHDIPQGLDLVRGESFYAFVGGADGYINEVDFFLDGSLLRTERYGPYDVGGGTRKAAAGLDTTDLDLGVHTLETHIRYDDGSGMETFVVTDSFELHAEGTSGADDLALTLLGSAAGEAGSFGPLQPFHSGDGLDGGHGAPEGLDGAGDGENGGHAVLVSEAFGLDYSASLDSIL